jgi:hypothetical protein
MNVTEITDQRLSRVLATFWICPHCGTVDAHPGRAAPDHKCGQCGERANGLSPAYFTSNVLSLIDLMQELYHLKADNALQLPAPENGKRNGHHLVLVILFCTLTEVLFQQFLEECMGRMGLQSKIQDRLLRDNLYMHQRMKRLFPTLTGVTWMDTAKQLGRRNKQNYEKSARFYEQASEVRNEFLHRGGDWVIPGEMPEQCLRQIKPLILFFVDLHNEYVAEAAVRRRKN